jgi:apolipoprotein N-acyltransferase
MSCTTPQSGIEGSLRPEVRRILASSRIEHPLGSGSVRSVFLLTLASSLLLWLSFTPVELAPAAWLALVPMLQLCRLQSLPAWSYSLIWVAGFSWGIATLQWMRLGHPAMYLALVALSLWVGLFFPVFVWLTRRAVRCRFPLWLSAPIVWTALELARAHLLTGFSWYYLGHSQYRWTALIQISDITGAYGVSFVVALVSAAIAVRVPARFLRRLNLDISAASDAPSYHSAIFTIASVFCCLGYGLLRQMPADGFPPGPVVALIQGNFTPELKHDSKLTLNRFRVHNTLMQNSIPLQPDFVVWPETMFPWPERTVAEGVSDEEILAQVPLEVLREYGKDAHLIVEPFRNQEVQKSLAGHAQGTGAALVIGLEATVAERNGPRTFNSAAFIRPDLGYVSRYDKIHRVMFGEYIPLRDLLPWLRDLTPFGAGFGISAGKDVRLFEYGSWNAAPLICFEDTVPQLVRRMAAQESPDGAPADLLINLTNDAWFHGSSELDQHLITAAFRCIENRIPMVRSVNGGISAFIDGNGRIREPDRIMKMEEPLQSVATFTELGSMRDPDTGHWHRQFSGIISGQVPLDPRTSLYTRFGDWFAGLCLLLTIVSTIAARWCSPQSHAVRPE